MRKIKKGIPIPGTSKRRDIHGLSKLGDSWGKRFALRRAESCNPYGRVKSIKLGADPSY